MRKHIIQSRMISRAARKDSKRKASQGHYENVWDAHLDGRITDHEAGDLINFPGHFGELNDGNSNKMWTDGEVHTRAGLNK